MHATSDDDVLSGIQALWQEVLGLAADRVQPDSHFLLLGGDSLQLARLLAKVQAAFGMSLPLHELSRYATPARMAACCSTRQGAAGSNYETVAGSLTDSCVVPATQVQQGIWLAEQLAAPHTLYLASALLHLHGPLNLSALQKSCAALFLQNPVLSARLCLDTATRRLQLQLETSRHSPEATQLVPENYAAHDLAATVQQAVLEPLQLDQGPLCRLRLFQLDTQYHVLLVSCHHVISDGWSGSNLMAQLAAGYTGALSQAELPAPEPDLHFLAYCRRLACQQEVDNTARLQWWRQRLAGMEQAQQWLWQGQFAEPWPHTVAVTCVPLPPSLMLLLRTRARAVQQSLFTLFLHAVKGGLYICSGVARQLLLVPTAQRQPAEEASIGCFIEPILLAGEWQPELDIDTALQIDAAGVAAARREQLPLATLAAALRPRSLPDGNPWSSILFAFQSYPQNALQWPGLTHRVEPVVDRSSQYALKLEILPGAAIREPWQLRIEYASALMEPARAAALAEAILLRLQLVAAS